MVTWRVSVSISNLAFNPERASTMAPAVGSLRLTTLPRPVSVAKASETRWVRPWVFPP